MDRAESSISVVIPVYRGGGAFRRCLEGLAALSPSPEEIIVVVDGEDDGSGIAAAASGAKVLQQPRRAGPAAARNAGAREAQGEILLFLDADVVAPPALIKQVQSAFNEEPALAALIGSYDDAPGDPGFLSQYRNLLHHYVHQTSNRQASTFWGACGAVRRGLFLEVGGFDERIEIPAMEDIELGYRLSAAGHRIDLLKEIQVKHLKRWSTLNMLRTDIFQRAIPWTRLLLRERRLENDLNLRNESRVSAVLAWLTLAALLTAPLWPMHAIVSAAAGGGVLLVINRPLYRFFLRKRGLWFTLGVIPWHWSYFLYASGAYLYVLLTDRIARKR